MTQQLKLEGKVAIVTGAGSSGPGVGTGKAMSVVFAREGAKVVLVDKYEDRAKETLGLIEDGGGEAIVVVADLADPLAADAVVEAATRHYGGVDILVNNAAMAPSTSILETSIELLDQIIAINLTAPFLLCKAVLPTMVSRGGGAILNVSSIAALRGQGGRGNTAYAASKAGLLGLTTDLADVFGKDGIRVNCVAPGILDTPMRNQTMLSRGIDPKSIDLSARTSLGVEGDAWDLARAALFLVGPDGAYITGVLLPVDGGSTARSH